MNAIEGSEMGLWQLTPKRGPRSENWNRSSYNGNEGSVIVRAASEDDARLVAADHFEQHAHSQNTLFSPWCCDTDTDISPSDDDRFAQHGPAEVLYPRVTAED